MSDPIFYTPDAPHSRPATEQELAEFLGGMTALDGTSYLDIYRESIAGEE